MNLFFIVDSGRLIIADFETKFSFLIWGPQIGISGVLMRVGRAKRGWGK